MVPEIIMCLLFVQNWVYTRNNREMNGKFDKRVVLCPLSKEMMSPGFILKAKKPYLLCEKVPSTLMADLLRFQRQVMAHMLPLKRRPVYTCQRRPVVCNEGDCQDSINEPSLEENHGYSVGLIVNHMVIVHMILITR